MPFGDNGLGPPQLLADLNEPHRRAVVADDRPLPVPVTAWAPKFCSRPSGADFIAGLPRSLGRSPRLCCSRPPRPGSVPGPRSAVYPLHGVGDILRL
jgi:hypothetical protein